MKTNFQILFACINHAKQIGRLETQIHKLKKQKQEILKKERTDENIEKLHILESQYQSYNYEITRLQANIDTALWILEE